MKETDIPHESLATGIGEDHFRVPGDCSVSDLDDSLRCWQPGEVEVEDRWGIGSMSSRSEEAYWVPRDQFEGLKKSKSRQVHGSKKLHRAGRRVFSCFRHSTINLVVREMEPSTPPKSGPLSAPRISVSGAHGGTFLDDAMDHHHDKNRGLNAEEPTSPVVNCMGQVRSNKTKKNKKKKIPAKKEEPLAVNDMDRFRRTKSRAPSSPSPPPRVPRSMSCKLKQLLRSNSSSISPSNHPSCDGEFEIDLCRFSSASRSTDPFYRDVPTVKKPDKTCLFMMRRSNSAGQAVSVNTDDPHVFFMEQRDSRNVDPVVDEADENHRTKEAAVEPSEEPVFRNLPKLKINKAMPESPKWLVDEPGLTRRRRQFKSSSTASGNS